MVNRDVMSAEQPGAASRVLVKDIFVANPLTFDGSSLCLKYTTNLKLQLHPRQTNTSHQSSALAQNFCSIKGQRSVAGELSGTCPTRCKRFDR